MQAGSLLSFHLRLLDIGSPIWGSGFRLQPCGDTPAQGSGGSSRQRTPAWPQELLFQHWVSVRSQDHLPGHRWGQGQESVFLMLFV